MIPTAKLRTAASLDRSSSGPAREILRKLASPVYIETKAGPQIMSCLRLRVSGQASFLTIVSMMTSPAHDNPWTPAARNRASKMKLDMNPATNTVAIPR